MKALVIVGLGVAILVIMAPGERAAVAGQGYYTGSATYEARLLKEHTFQGAPQFSLVEIIGSSTNNNQSGLFHNMKFSCTYAVEIIGNSTRGNGYCTFTGTGGDSVLVKLNATGEVGRFGIDGTMEFVAGTGRYQGIQGGGWVKTISLPAGTQSNIKGEAFVGGSYILP